MSFGRKRRMFSRRHLCLIRRGGLFRLWSTTFLAVDPKNDERLTMRKPRKGDLVEAEAEWIGDRLTRPPLWRRVLCLLFPPVNLFEQ